jgi:hypothetical protein
MARLRPAGRPSLYADLRTAVAQTTGQPPVQTEQLARLTWKKVLTLLGAFAVIYLLLPQLKTIRERYGLVAVGPFRCSQSCASRAKSCAKFTGRPSAP